MFHLRNLTFLVTVLNLLGMVIALGISPYLTVAIPGIMLMALLLAFPGSDRLSHDELTAYFESGLVSAMMLVLALIVLTPLL